MGQKLQDIVRGFYRTAAAATVSLSLLAGCATEREGTAYNTPILKGNIPEDIDPDVNRIYFFVKEMVSNTLGQQYEGPAPIIYFISRDASGLSGAEQRDHAEFYAFEEQWLTENPLAKQLLERESVFAHRYRGTNVIWISAEFCDHLRWQNLDLGVTVIKDGHCYPVIGHEFEHYVLGKLQPEIPDCKHHERFIEYGWESMLGSFLVKQKLWMQNSLVAYGYKLPQLKGQACQS